jgi:hypothetical protein
MYANKNTKEKEITEKNKIDHQGNDHSGGPCVLSIYDPSVRSIAMHFLSPPN